MSYRIPNPVFRRNLFLITAAVLLLLAVFASPPILFSLGSTRGLVFTACMAISGLLVVLGIRECANTFLRRPGEPWYIRPGAAIFIPIIMMCTNALACLVYNLAFRLFDLSYVIPQRAIVFEFMAMEFLWIAILDWPARHERPYSDAGYSRGPPPPKPHFKSFNNKPCKNEPF